MVEYRFVTPGYFVTMGIPVLKGSDVSEHDTAVSEAVCLINAAMAQQFWPGADPLARI